MKKKYIVKNINILIISIVSILIPQYTKAITIESIMPNLIPIQRSQVNQQYYNNNIIYTDTFEGQIYQSINKEINLRVGTQNLNQTGSTVSTGSNIVLQNNPSRGNYVLTGASFDTPPMDGIAYYFGETITLPDGRQIRGNKSVAETPKDTGTVLLTSNDSNIIDCSGTSCVALNAGTANITVQFNQVTLPTCVNGTYWDGKNSTVANWNHPSNYLTGYGQGNIIIDSGNDAYTPISFCGDPRSRGSSTYISSGYGGYFSFFVGKMGYPYTYPNITYTITVAGTSVGPNTGGGGGGNTITNTPPTAQYQSTSTITTNTATATYSYSDADGDMQTGSQLQVSTDPSFSNIIFNRTYIGTNNVRQITGLSPNTMYYPRVRVSNQINGNSAWAVGPAFTTANMPNPIAEMKIWPISSYRTQIDDTNSFVPFDEGVWITPAVVSPGAPFALSWASEGMANSHRCYSRSSGQNWEFREWDLSTDGIKKVETVNLIAPNTGGTYTYILDCQINPDTVSLNLMPIERGYSKNRLYAVSYLGNDIKSYSMYGTITVLPTNNASLDFTINGSTEPLTVPAGGDLNFNWTTTNPDRFSECQASTDPNYTSWDGDKAKTGGTQTSKAPSTNSNVTYRFRLVCSGPGIADMKEIEVMVTPLPLVSCTLDKKVVQDNTTVTITGAIDNAFGTAPFGWILDDGKGNILPEKITTDPNERVSWDIDYSGLGLAKITPKITFRDSYNPAFSVQRTCETITSLGDSTIREVSP